MDAILETLQQFWLALLQGELPPLGYWNYLLLMVFIIIQGPISTMLGGAAASAGLLNPYAVLAVAMFGNLSADAFWYSVGYTGKTLWIDRVLRRHRALVAALQQAMQAHALKILLLAKLSLGMAVPAVVAAGLARVPWRRWFPVVMGGEVIFTGTLLLIGYYATEMIKGAERGVLYFGAAASAVLIVAMVVMAPRVLRSYLGDHATTTE